MAMLNNQMVYNFSFSHLGNCGTGVDFILPNFLADFEVSDGFLMVFWCLFLPFFEVFVPFPSTLCR